MLFEDPLSGQASVSADPSALCEVAAAATEAISAWATLPDADLRHDYGFVARLVAFAAAKAQLTQEIGRGSATIAALEAHQARIPALRAEFEERWLESARRSEIHLTLRHFDLLSQSYAKALEWLRNPVGAYEPLATPLLWEQGRAEIRKLTELTGDGENVPELEQG
jgi:hypothetical protein